MKEKKDLIEEITNCLNHSSTVTIESIPNIDLYMDQVTTFIETALFGY